MDENSDKRHRSKSLSGKRRNRHADQDAFDDIDEETNRRTSDPSRKTFSEYTTERNSSHKKHRKGSQSKRHFPDTSASLEDTTEQHSSHKKRRKGSHSKRHHHHHSKHHHHHSEHKKRSSLPDDERYFDASSVEMGSEDKQHLAVYRNDSNAAHIERGARPMGHRLENHPIDRSSSEELQQRRRILLCVAISVSIGTVIGALIGYGIYAWVSTIQSGSVELNILNRNNVIKDVFNFRATTRATIKNKISEGNEDIYNEMKTDSKPTLDVKVGINGLGCGKLHESVQKFRQNTRQERQKEQNDKQKINGRIVGGKFALIEHHPWQVSLWASSSHTCGGSIIASNWILFAAHCAIPYPKAENWTVHVGETDRRYMMERGQTLKVSDLVVQESFDEDTFDNDLALLRLDRDVQLNDKVQTICLPSLNRKVQPDTMGTISGWGASSEDDWRLPHRLQYTTVITISRDICNADDWLMGMVTKNMFCAGTEDGSRDACQGDSGGPLTYYDPKEDRFYLMGAVSWGIGCGEPLMPGVYTNLPLYLNWIREAMTRVERRYFPKS